MVGATEYWVKDVHPKKCALKRWMGKSCQDKVPKGELREIVKTPIGGKWHGRTVTRQAKSRANFALVARGFRHPGRNKAKARGRR